MTVWSKFSTCLGTEGKLKTYPTSASPLGKFALDFPLGVGLLFCLALVVKLFSSGDRQLDFRQAILEVDPQRHKREAAFGGLAGEAGNLATVQQQLARTLGLVIHAIPHRV